MEYDEIEDLLVAKLKALGAAKKFEVYEADIPLGTARTYVGHNSPPYVIIDFGGVGQHSDDQRGIVGVRADFKWTSIVFDVVSNNPATNRQIARIIRNEFEGFVPHETWGEMVERVAAPLFARQQSEGGELHPPRYHKTIAFVVDVNA